MVVAAFDVDGTLTTRDCVRPFLERVAGRRRLVTSVLRRPLATIAAAVRRDRDRFKEIIVGGSLRGKLVADVEKQGEQFAAVRARQLAAAGHAAPAALASAQRAPHRARVGVAGAVPAAAGTAARHRRRAVHRLDCAAVIGTATGSTAPTAAAAEKRRASTQWLEEQRWVDAEVWAYGDSAGDRELLARADHAVWVNGETISEVARGGRWMTSSPVPAGTPEAVGQEPAGVRRARRRRRARPGRTLWPAFVIFVAFCLASSGTYFWNDLLDVEHDRNHPTKQHRPIASGAIPSASPASSARSCSSPASAWRRPRAGRPAVVVAGYVVLTSMYSVVLKHIAVVDLVAVAAGFVLRAVAGAVATDVPMSKWFALTISFGSLFIVTGKRYAELRELGDDAQTRATLDDYSLGFLRIVLSVSCGAAL